MERPIRGAAPPPSLGPAIEVTRILGTVPRMFTIISASPWGAFFHFYGGRSRECYGQDDPTHCDRCAKAWPRNWRAYVHVVEHQGQTSSTAILELTQVALQAIFDQVGNKPTLRGVLIRAAKTKGGKHGRFVIEVLPRAAIQTSDIREIEPEPIVRKLWKINEDRADQSNKQS